MKTRVLQGRDFLNFVENTQNFGEHASKLCIELTLLKDASMVYYTGFIQNDFLFCMAVLVSDIAGFVLKGMSNSNQPWRLAFRGTWQRWTASSSSSRIRAEL